MKNVGVPDIAAAIEAEKAQERAMKDIRDYRAQYKDAMIATLLRGALYADPNGRLFIPSTGMGHVWRINIDRLTRDDLLTLGEQYAVFIAKKMELDSWNPFRHQRFKYVAADSPRARKLAKIVVDHWANDGVKKELIDIPDDERRFKGKAIVVDDAARTGLTLARSALWLQDHGADVVRLFTVFDYQQGTDDTLCEAFKDRFDRTPRLECILQRQDGPFLRDWKIKRDEAETRLYHGLFEYLKGPIRYCVNHLHKGFVLDRKEPADIVMSTREGQDPVVAAQDAMARAILRLTLEVAMYPREQDIWPDPHQPLKDWQKPYLRIHGMQKVELTTRMDEVRTFYLEKYCPSGLPWMEALPSMIKETITNAKENGYSLNGQGLEHMRSVRNIFRELKSKHQPGIPYNIFGLPEWQDYPSVPRNV